MAVAARAAALTAQQLDEARAVVGSLESEHGAAPMIGRTLGQYALPTNFSNVTGRWCRGLGEAADALRALVPTLPVQLGGPVGDGSSYGSSAADVVAGVAERIGLAVPDGPWGTMRTPVARVAGAWGLVGVVVGDVATQLVALMASDVGELTERADGAGGSSSMAHKHNPVAAISARAAAMAAARPRRHAAAGRRRPRLRAGIGGVARRVAGVQRLAAHRRRRRRVAGDEPAPRRRRPAAHGRQPGDRREGAHHMTDLAVVDTGDPDGPPIIWLGSLGSATAMWHRQVESSERPAAACSSTTPATVPAHRPTGRCRSRRSAPACSPPSTGSGSSGPTSSASRWGRWRRCRSPPEHPERGRPSGAAVHERPLRLIRTHGPSGRRPCAPMGRRRSPPRWSVVG